MSRREITLGRIWWLCIPLFLYYFVNNAVVFTGMQFWELQGGMWETESRSFTVYFQTAVRMAGMLLGGVAVYPFYCKIPHEILQSDRTYGKKEMLYTMAAGAVLGAGLNLLFFLLGFTGSSEAYDKVAAVQFAVPLWLAVIFYGILSPLVEEMVFRGILYRTLKQNLGRLGAAIGSALLFGGFHGNIVQAVYGSIMGMCLAVCYEKYGKIAAPVLFHSAANIVVYMLAS